MTTTEKQAIAKQVNGLLASGSLNWRGDFDMQTKKEHFSIYFNKESQARKAIAKVGGELCKTPKHVNYYFKYFVLITL